MSRRPRGEQNFGSDAFLDVVCNVVGILIILMVVAGMRAAKSPVLLRDTPADLPPAMPITRPSAEPEPDAPEISLGEVALPEPLSVDPPAAAMPQEPSADLVSAVERLRGELAGLVAEHEATVARVTSTHEQQTRWEEKLARARELVNRQRTSLEAARETKAATTVALSRLQDTVAQLRLQLDQTDAKTPKLQQIEHRITPIGQTVTGRELHFQVLGNRVALIPLEPLIDRLKDQIERRKDWLAKSRQHMGQVGPVGGFSMNYVVQRDNMSVVDEVRLGGQGMFRISVSSWQLQPERDLVTESVAQALEPGSRFYAALLEAGDAAALTFWVYPDSFEAFSDLKRFCHSQNFLVAGRPLPHGVPISGSPTGSRSAGQ